MPEERQRRAGVCFEEVVAVPLHPSEELLSWLEHVKQMQAGMQVFGDPGVADHVEVAVLDGPVKAREPAQVCVGVAVPQLADDAERGERAQKACVQILNPLVLQSVRVSSQRVAAVRISQS